MEELTGTEIWRRALKEIAKVITPLNFRTWFSATKVCTDSLEPLKIGVPSQFFKDWLFEHYLSVIKEALKKVSGRGIEVQLVAAPNLFSSLEGEGSVRLRPEASKTYRKDTEEAVGLNPKYTFDSFVIGPSNRFAYAASLAVAESPARTYNPLFIYGKVGLGKTHLMQAIGRHIMNKHTKLNVCYISSEDFTNQLILSIQNRTTLKFRQRYRNVDVLLIDDVHFLAGKESTQEEFFHTFNTLYDAHKQVVLSSDRPPKEIHTMEERLISRFEWGLVTDIQPPDLETRIAILRKKTEKETVEVPDKIISFIAERIKTNIRELEGAIIRVVAYSTLMGREINLELAQEVLRDMVKEEEARVTIEIIQKRVAEYFNISISDIKAKRKSKAVVFPRQVAMYLVREFCDYSLPEIGNLFGGRDHTTVLHAYNKIKQGIKSDHKIRGLIEGLTINIKQ